MERKYISDEHEMTKLNKRRIMVLVTNLKIVNYASALV